MRKHELDQIRRDVVYRVLDFCGPATNGQLARVFGARTRVIRGVLTDLQRRGRTDYVKIGKRYIWTTTGQNPMFG